MPDFTHSSTQCVQVDKYNMQVADGLAHAMDVLKNNP